MAKVLLIVFNSLRKDTFDECHHPLLEKWREKGVVYENCFSQSGFTLISFASFLTGCFPSHNSVHSKGPAFHSLGPEERSISPIWWSVDEKSHINLRIEGSHPLEQSVMSRFKHKLLTIAYPKTNAFRELTQQEMCHSLEYGSASTAFYNQFQFVGSQDDFLIVLRIYDTHWPYGRGISPCDAPTPIEIKKKIAALFAEQDGRRKLEKIVTKAFERSLSYLSGLWQQLEPKLDFVAIMSEHGEQWSDNWEQVGHAAFLSNSVLQVPLIVIDNEHTGRCWTPCNNVDICPTLLQTVGKKVNWLMDGLSLNSSPRPVFETEANSIQGQFLTTQIRNTVTLFPS